MSNENTEATGDCYAVAAREQKNGEALVHAEVMGQGKLAGETFGHAYVVYTKDGLEFVRDYSNGSKIDMPRAIYEALGQIRWIDNRHEYSAKEAAALMLKHGHYGPWDLKTSSGY